MGTSSLPRGRTVAHRIADQTAFAIVATGAFNELNAYSSTFNKKRPLDDDDVLGQVGYANIVDARPAAPGVEDADGTMSVPLDINQIGFWLKGLLGAAQDSGASAPYSHVFTSGGLILPTRTIEKQLASGQFEAMIGAIVKEMTFPFQPEKGYEACDVSLVGRQVTDPYTATIAGTPTVQALTARVPKAAGTLLINGTAVGRITQGAMKVTNTIDTDRYAGDDKQSDAFLTKTDVSLDITARYTTDTLRNLGALNGASLPAVQTLEVDYILSAALSLKLVCPAVRFEPSAAPTTNGGLMTNKLTGRAEIGAAGPMLTATLVNNVATYGA